MGGFLPSAPEVTREPVPVAETETEDERQRRESNTRARRGRTRGRRTLLNVETGATGARQQV